MTATENRPPEVYLLKPTGGIPNNPRLPVLVQRTAIAPDPNDPAAAFERVFQANDWKRSWRNGIFAFHHYHSNAHEVLGIASGSASVQLGGSAGLLLELAAGDVVVLPAGTGHCNLGASEDFLVVGAYPDGPDWDLCRAGDIPMDRALTIVANVPIPASDPVDGAKGSVVDHWR